MQCEVWGCKVCNVWVLVCVGVLCVGVGVQCVCVGVQCWCWCAVCHAEPPPPLPSHRVSIQHAPVCAFKTSPCVPAQRLHVFTHVGVGEIDTNTQQHNTTPAQQRSKNNSTPATTAQQHQQRTRDDHGKTQFGSRFRHGSHLTPHSLQVSMMIG